MKTFYGPHRLMDFLRRLASHEERASLLYPASNDAQPDALAENMSELDRLEEEGVVLLTDRRMINVRPAFVTVELTSEARDWLRAQWPRETGAMKR